MAAIDDLIQQVSDETLRNRIKQEINRINKQKKFGLVFESHIPECTPLYDIKVKKGSLVAKKAGKINDIYSVLKIDGDNAICYHRTSKTEETIPIHDLVSIAQFGNPIYPTLQPVDSICNASESSLWHTLIEADNYHALQLLEYLYPYQVDCIYIDPPYNTGARDWKYNNDYVDSSDSYRHSKWLSMMERRLKIAKRLLNPKDSVLIVTIDEKEYLHLGCLLEDLFPNARMQMVSSVINVKGVARESEFSRVNEFIFIVQFGESSVDKLALPEEWLGNVRSSSRTKLRLGSMLRSGSNSERRHSPGCFYPLFFKENGTFVGAGLPIAINVDYHSIPTPDGCVAVWPIHKNGSDGVWQYSRDNFLKLVDEGFVYFGKLKGNRIGISYAPKGVRKKIEGGQFSVSGYNEDGTAIIDDSQYVSTFIPGNQWAIPSHNSTEYGTKLLQDIIGKRFSYPKSLYAVHDTIRFFVEKKPNALIVDFFAGSGTTLHAVNLLNAMDNGNRRCIMVTNNEVSDEEAKILSKSGHKPGDEEWEKLGIARYVNWPRTVCSIKGVDVTGEPLKGNYLIGDKPMANGFKSNVEFFKLGFLDKTSVALGRQFKEILPILWMKNGAIGKRPQIEGKIPDMLILPDNQMAILINTGHFLSFSEQVSKYPEIQTVFLVTDSIDGYQEMASSLVSVKRTFQLYRDYLDNFRINSNK